MNADLKTISALVRREMWEHRAFWLVPTVIASMFTLLMMRAGVELIDPGHAHDIARMNEKVADKLALDGFLQQTDMAATAFAAAGLPFAICLGFLIVFYLLDSLYSDRRDRSVLFWRSMPVTDVQTVLSKLATATIAGPVATLAVLTAAFAAWGGLVALFGSWAGFDYWWLGLNPLAWLEAAVSLFGAHVGFMLVSAPIIGWVLLASAWAPRAPFLWAALPPLAVGMFENMFFESNRFLEAIGRHYEVLVPQIFIDHDHLREVAIRGDGYKVSLGPAFALSADYLTEPRLYLGIAIGAGFVAGAVWMRRFRDDAAY
jgi:ABC-2 type transport system permease protein